MNEPVATMMLRERGGSYGTARRLPMRIASRQGTWCALYVGMFLPLAVLLGGSTRGGFFANAALQSIGATALMVMLLVPRRESGTSDERGLRWILAAAFAVPLLQLLPLPHTEWAALPGRAAIARDMALLDLTTGWMPVTLDRDATIAALLALLPPASVIVAMARVDRRYHSPIAVILVCTVLAAIGLGVLQVAQGASATLYLYDYASFGSAAGFFANANHQGLLCVMCLPLVAAIVTDFRRPGARRRGRRDQAPVILALAVMLLPAAGAVLTGSRMALLLVGPALLLGAWLAIRGTSGMRVSVPGGLAWVAAIAALLVILFLISAHTPLAGGGSDVTRLAIWQTSVGVMRDHFPVGSGLGTFARAYAIAAPHGALSARYVNHAHNDYLELLLEAGIAGALLLLLAIGWYLRCIARVASMSRPDPWPIVAMAGLAVLALGSFVEYPGRTAAIACIAAFYAAILASHRRLGHVL